MRRPVRWPNHSRNICGCDEMATLNLGTEVRAIELGMDALVEDLKRTFADLKRIRARVKKIAPKVQAVEAKIKPK